MKKLFLPLIAVITMALHAGQQNSLNRYRLMPK
jgi:hypothetical protein